MGRLNVATNPFQLLPSSCGVTPHTPESGLTYWNVTGHRENPGPQPPANASWEPCERGHRGPRRPLAAVLVIPARPAQSWLADLFSKS